jgi:hypothetical protein
MKTFTYIYTTIAVNFLFPIKAAYSPKFQELYVPPLLVNNF